MIRTETLIKHWRIGAVAILAAAPAVLVPSPSAFRPSDPLQAVAVGSARDAVAETRHDPWGLARALIAPFQKLAAPVDPVSTPTPAIPVDPSALAYAVAPSVPDATAGLDPEVTLGISVATVREGVDAYRRGDVAAGDLIAARTTDPLTATTISWAWLRTHAREAGVGRISKFIADHPDWPANDWLRKRIEDAFYADKPSPTKVKAWFAGRTPLTPLGRIALARALRDSGDGDAAAGLIRTVWGRDDLSPFAETALRKQFGDVLTIGDQKLRADRLMYKEDDAGALRIAALSGDKDLLAFEKVRAAAQNGPLPDKLLATVPAKYLADPALRFAKIQIARRADKLDEAAALMLGAPRDPAAIIDGDEWWTERRLIARKLLDAGQLEKAYQIAAQHSAASNETKIEAEFHAGWVALRFLNDPVRAKPHFAKLADLAQTPMSKARAAYWQGRAAEAAKEPADGFYQAASVYSSTYYGQLAALRQGSAAGPNGPLGVAEGNARSEAVRAVDALYLAGAKDLAVPLATEGARYLKEAEQVRALARVVARDRDAKVSLAVGKLSAQRGVVVDDLAFPTYGVPDFTPLSNSAPLPLVYAIARQESAFDPNAMSSAGAMGLMQMIASTAKRTAQRAGLAFDALRMRAEPAFNAQLGAAHLAELLGEHNNSTVLTLVAYNAGGRRAKEWIAAYGDPRKANVDVVDWIERIPFSETRNYVQRVSENLAVYRARLASVATPAPIAAKIPSPTESDQPAPAGNATVVVSSQVAAPKM